MMDKTKFKSIETGKTVIMWPSTDHTQSSYGLPVWVDKTNYCYGQCDLWPVPFGFIKVVTKESKAKEYNLEVRKMYGSWIKQIREDKGMTQQELGVKMKLDRSTISKIEDGKWNFGIDTLTLFAQHLDFYLFFLEKESTDELAVAMRERWKLAHEGN